MRGNERGKREDGRVSQPRSKEFCACGGMNQMPCKGVCRKSHLTTTGYIKCGEFYRLEPPRRQRRDHRARPRVEDQARRTNNERRGRE